METKKQTVRKSQLRRKYDADFKRSAIELILNGQSITQVSQSLGIGESLLYKWRNEQTGKPNKKGSSITSSTLNEVSSVYSENEALRKQVKQLEMERDILKKALGIFSRVT
jgi:transposase